MKNLEKLQSYFLHAGFTETDDGLIAGSFSRKKIVKGDYFVQEGKTSRHLGVVETGFSSILYCRMVKKKQLIGLNFRIGAIAVAAKRQSLQINPAPGTSYSVKF
jgi:hypothetical protein